MRKSRFCTWVLPTTPTDAWTSPRDSLQNTYILCHAAEKTLQLVRALGTETTGENGYSKFIVYFSTCAAVDYFYRVSRRGNRGFAHRAYKYPAHTPALSCSWPIRSSVVSRNCHISTFLPSTATYHRPSEPRPSPHSPPIPPPRSAPLSSYAPTLLLEGSICRMSMSSCSMMRRWIRKCLVIAQGEQRGWAGRVRGSCC